MSFGRCSIDSLYRDLKHEWAKKTPNLKKMGPLLDCIKLEVLKVGFLSKGNTKKQHNDMITARGMLEIAVEYSVAVKDYDAYNRYMSQLKTYYYDFKRIIGESEHMYKLLALNLLYLLAQNRVADFHVELERLPGCVIDCNKYVRPILVLEQYIMEGRYNKILQAKNSMPTELYNNLLDLLMISVREQIASCIEKAYEKMSPQDAAKRLDLKSMDELKNIAKKRKWQLDKDGNYNFTELFVKPKENVPSYELAEQVIFYARELEKIV